MDLHPTIRIAALSLLTAMGASTLAAQAPIAVSVSPSAGTGHYQDFTFTWTDPVAQSNIGHLQVMFNNNLSASGSCWILTDRANIYFHDDSGNQLAGTPFGSGTLLQNSQCAVYPWASSLTPITATGTTATLTLRVVFFTAYMGSQAIWMAASNAYSGGWASKGTYSVTEHPPVVNQTTLPPSPGWQATFPFSYTYPDNAVDMDDVQLMINNGTDPYYYCFAVVNSGGWIYLADDNGNVMAPVQAGAPGTPTGNSRCSISGAASSLTSSTNTWALNLAVTFTSLYAGPRNISTLAVDQSLITSGWFNLGPWTVTAVGNGGDPITTVIEYIHLGSRVIATENGVGTGHN
jgi:hypothetical protein